VPRKARAISSVDFGGFRDQEGVHDPETRHADGGTLVHHLLRHARSSISLRKCCRRPGISGHKCLNTPGGSLLGTLEDFLLKKNASTTQGIRASGSGNHPKRLSRWQLRDRPIGPRDACPYGGCPNHHVERSCAEQTEGRRGSTSLLCRRGGGGRGCHRRDREAVMP